jgi:DNA-directed RNA polymerase subunit M/transcription elongation factor TFIIS
MKAYCPDCIVKMIYDRKKIGGINVWLKCPKCGYRVQPIVEKHNEQEKNEILTETIKITNKQYSFED